MALAEQVLASGQNFKGAYYLRAAEFFMWPADPDKQPTRARYLSLVREHYGLGQNDLISVPYEHGLLPTYRFTQAKAKGTLVIFGGFDGYIEELFGICLALRAAGYEVIAFDGPGQGGALEDSHLSMTHEWEKPVKAVLDFFGLEDVTLMGVSLGGYLAMRAAAFEPRVRRVIADDVLTDFWECQLRQLSAPQRSLLQALMRAREEHLVNVLLEQAMKKSLVAEWGIKQGMHVMGSQTPYEFMQKVRLYRTVPFSARVTQDVLLMAGVQDHLVPQNQFSDQIAQLTQVHSLTARLFTRFDQAQEHIQVGNIGLSVRVIIDWLDWLQHRGKEA
jgi:pimeloyl-ACP methyl ester carboxylesterase